MESLLPLVKAIAVIVLLYFAAIILRYRKILNEDHSLILARIVTDLCLPAMIFVSLADNSVKFQQLGPAFEMLALDLSIILFAWLVSIQLKLSRANQGAVVFCSAFGSSTFLGYPLIVQMFPEQPEALTEAVLISEIGVGYPIFILGPILASFFGSKVNDKNALLTSSLKFFRSPVFIALIAGIAWGNFQLPREENDFLAPFFQSGHVLASALTPMAVLSIGLMFKLPSVRHILIALAMVILIKLLLKPFLAGYFAHILGFPDLWKDVLILLAAMPPAILGVVFLRRYGGDASLASALLLAATIMSIPTMLIVFYYLG